MLTRTVSAEKVTSSTRRDHRRGEGHTKHKANVVVDPHIYSVRNSVLWSCAKIGNKRKQLFA